MHSGLFSRRASVALVAAAAAASLTFVASPPAAAADGGTTSALTLPIERIESTTADRRVYAEITLKRGVDWEPAVRAWQLGGPADVTLVLYDPYGMPHSKIQLENAWPSALGSDSLGGDEPELSLATLTVVCDGIRRVDP